MKTSLVVVGAVDGTASAVEALIALECAPTGIVTLPIASAGRHSDFFDLRPLCKRHEIAVIETNNINAPASVEAVSALRPDIIAVLGWSQFIGPNLLRLPSVGVIGFHPSKLPDNRGRGVIAWTILQRRDATGATLFWMDEGMDSGDLVFQRELFIDPDETALTLIAKQKRALCSMLAEMVGYLRRGEDLPRKPQDHSLATYCSQRVPADGAIDWSDDADTVWTLVRASGKPYAGAFCFLGSRKLTIWEATPSVSERFWGIPGQVQCVDPLDGVLVHAGRRTNLYLKTVELEGDGPRPAIEVLRRQDRLTSKPRGE